MVKAQEKEITDLKSRMESVKDSNEALTKQLQKVSDSGGGSMVDSAKVVTSFLPLFHCNATINLCNLGRTTM